VEFLEDIIGRGNRGNSGNSGTDGTFSGGWATLREGSNLGTGRFDFWKGPG
jgi:hypothetical protein